MKKLCTLLVALFLIVGAGLLPVVAQAASTSDLTFALNDDGNSYYVSSCNEYAQGTLTIPATYNGKPVTEIGIAAFYECKKLETVIIPDSIIHIGDSAFYGCWKLNRISFGSGLRSIGADAFDGFFPDRIDIVDLSAWCKISFSNSNSIPYGAKMFLNGKLLTQLIIPSDVTSIGSYSFRGNDSITSITIHDNVTTIGESAFYGVDTLTSLDIGDGVTDIGDWAFGCCFALKNITWGKRVTYIGDNAFHSCDGIVNVKLPDSVKEIGPNAFASCANLTTIDVGSSATFIGDWAFSSCERLTSITIPRTMKEIGPWAFNECRNLRNVYFDGTKAEWNSIEFNFSNDYLINATLNLTNPCAAGHSYTIGGSVDEANHKLICKACSGEELAAHSWAGSITKAATCMETGIKTYTCSGCKATKTETIEKLTTHTFDSWTMVDDSTHKHSCAICSHEETASHSWSDAVTKAATCVETGVKTYTCSGCNTTKTEIIEKLTTHTYDNDCDKDCNFCNAARPTDHVYDNDCDAVCNICATLREIQHTCQDAWDSNEKKHWHTCTICGQKTDVADHTPRSEATENSAQSCTVCEKVIAPALTNQTQDSTISAETIAIICLSAALVGTVAFIVLKKRR